MYKIGEFAKLSWVSPHTLRYYDELGLLSPAEIDGQSGYRYYTAEQLPRLHRILALKDLGLSLDQIGQMLDEDLSLEDLRAMLRLKRAELEGQVQEARERLARVEARLRLIEMEGSMPDYEVVLKTVEPLRVASVRDTIPNMDVTGPTFNRLFDEVAEHILGHGAQFAGPGLDLWHDSEGQKTDIPVEAAIPFQGDLPDGERVKVRQLPRRLMACVVHHGSFDGFPQAFKAGFDWIQANGYRLNGSVREVYLQYERDGDPADYVSEIQFPVEKE